MQIYFIEKTCRKNISILLYQLEIKMFFFQNLHMHCQQQQPLHINSECIFLKGVLG